VSNPARVRPLAPEEWSVQARELLAGTAGPVHELEGGTGRPSSGTLNILKTIAHHPSLLGPFLGFASALAMQGLLPRRSHELLALRAAWNCRSAFEWGHHVVFARAASLRDEEIARIPSGPAHPAWSDEDRLLLRAADELHRDQQLSERTWSELRRRLTDAQLVELPFVVGNYTMLSMLANATGVPVEPGLAPLPAAPPGA
jgi:alkylhydroperoxidase family enzyme